MNPSLHLSVLAITLALSATAVGCSHPDRTRESSPRSSSGDERRAPSERSRLTAMDQSENAVDLEISRQIRESVVSDASLSFGARNCAIITRDRVVTLRGDVTGAEETTLLHHAWATANVIRVVDDLNVTR